MDSLFSSVSKKKRSFKDRSYDLKTGHIVAKEVQELFKKWKTLEKDITRKEAQVEKGRYSKELEPCQNDRNKLKQQLQDDIRLLEKVLEHNYASLLDRKDIKRHTTGDIKEKKSESFHKHHEAGRPMGSGQVHYPGAQREQNKIDALEKECARLKKYLEDSENEKAALKFSHREKIWSLEKELSDLKERTKEYEQVQRQAASTDQKGKDIVKEECKKLTLDKPSYEKREKELQTKCDELEADVVSYKENWTKSEDAKLQLEIKIMELENKSKDGEREIKTWKDRYNSLDQEKRRIEEELKRLTIDKSSYEKREKELKTKCYDLEADVASYKENWRKSEDAKIQLEIKITELENKSKEGEWEIKIWKNLCNSLEEEKRRTEGELKRMEALNNELRIQHENERKDKEDALLRLEAKINQLTNQLDNERKAKEDALLRLSSMGSKKLRDNNPNIADLSDLIRPTKLSEQFSELFDNEWTDAFDELEKLLGDKEDKEIISYLRDFVLEIHSFCCDTSSSKLETIEEAFVKPSVPSEDTKIPTEIFETIKDGIKSIAPKLLEHTRERVLGRLEEKYFTDPVAGCLQHQYVKRYIDKCTEVCWYMSVQDPQLVMDGSKSPDEKFDSNKHREYTKKGPYEEFVVWPVLYLYRGGQMLSKGVAQGATKMIGQ